MHGIVRGSVEIAGNGAQFKVEMWQLSEWGANWSTNEQVVGKVTAGTWKTIGNPRTGASEA